MVEIARFGLRIQRFDEYPLVVAGKALRGVAQIIDKHGLAGCAIQPRRYHAGHDMYLRATELAGILQRQLNIASGLRASPGNGGEPPFSGVDVAGWGIEQHQLQLVLLQALSDFPGGILIGKKKLNGFKSRPGSGGKAFQNGSSVNSMDKFAANFGMVLSQFFHFVSGQVADLAVAEGKYQPCGIFQFLGIVGGFAKR